jgi:hypothetical protein
MPDCDIRDVANRANTMIEQEIPTIYDKFRKLNFHDGVLSQGVYASLATQLKRASASHTRSEYTGAHLSWIMVAGTRASMALQLS